MLVGHLLLVDQHLLLGDAGLLADTPPRLTDPPGTYVYDLFAVINHEGQMNNGHYTNFARYGREVRRSCLDEVDFPSDDENVAVVPL